MSSGVLAPVMACIVVSVCVVRVCVFKCVCITSSSSRVLAPVTVLAECVYVCV